jgi:hypothetical protein
MKNSNPLATAPAVILSFTQVVIGSLLILCLLITLAVYDWKLRHVPNPPSHGCVDAHYYLNPTEILQVCGKIVVR